MSWFLIILIIKDIKKTTFSVTNYKYHTLNHILSNNIESNNNFCNIIFDLSFLILKLLIVVQRGGMMNKKGFLIFALVIIIFRLLLLLFIVLI